MNQKEPKPSPKREYPPLYERAIPIVLTIIIVAILVLLVVILAVFLGLFPA